MEDTIKTLSQEEKTEIENKIMDMDPEDIKKLYTEQNPHPTGAYWDPTESKWKGYKAVKGMSPPWVPYSKKRKRIKPNMRETKFMMILSKTGSLVEAYRSTYLVRQYDDKRVEAARCRGNGQQILSRIKKSFPEWVSAFTFSDITPDFVKNEMMNLYNNPHATIAEKTRLIELMGKTEALFTDKQIIDTKIRDVVNPVYRETDEDFPEFKDQRVSRLEIEKKDIANSA